MKKAFVWKEELWSANTKEFHPTNASTKNAKTAGKTKKVSQPVEQPRLAAFGQGAAPTG